jgi:hypothetical protein
MEKNCLKWVHQMETDIEIGSSLLWTFSLRMREERKIKWNAPSTCSVPIKEIFLLLFSWKCVKNGILWMFESSDRQ